MTTQKEPVRKESFLAQRSRLSPGAILVCCLLLFSTISFILISWRVFILKVVQSDFRIFDWCSHFVNKTNNGIMSFITFFGTHIFLIPANLLLIAYFLFYRKNKWVAIKIPCVAISSLLVMTLLKILFARDRPDTPLLEAARGYSFPSGHAFMSMTFYGLIIYMIIKSEMKNWLKWILSVLFALLILIIGFTRIYLKVHYPSDVFAGFTSGFIWLVISILILNKIERFSNRRHDPLKTSQSV